MVIVERLLDDATLLKGYTEIKGQASSLLHFHSSESTFHKKCSDLAEKKAKAMSGVRFTKYRTGNTFSL